MSQQEQLAIFPSKEKKKNKRKRLYLTWAALIRRIFEENPLRCPCGAELRIVKFLTEAAECADFLQAHGLEAPTVDPRPARSPPGLEDFVDPTPPDDCMASILPAAKNEPLTRFSTGKFVVKG